ncbi:MAG: hypothetical protein HKP61_17820 [Dactylosporangium sp.]|nr:hypothetical protein [Dactylosporangium sp.]NNJ62756.1 hypothetical protein [Dactylosporangium sp.]
MVTGETSAVDPVRLRAVASEVEQAVAALDTAHRSRDGLLTPELPNWGATSSARAASAAWATFVGRLAGDVRGLVDGMRTAADGYTAADANAARLLEKGR